MIKQSICFPLYKQEGMDLRELFREYKKIGYAAVELWKRPENFDAIVDAAQGAGLVIASMSGHDSLTEGLNDPSHHDRIEAELEESIELAARIGIPGLICFSGNRVPGQDDTEGLDNTVRGLKRVIAFAEEKGVNLNIELLNSKVDHPGYQCDRSSWGFEVCRRVDSGRMKVLYDIYHMQIMEGDLIRTIKENIDLIGHFHTAGNPGRLDFDDEQELNYAGICGAIAATGYRLYVGHEFKPKHQPLQSLARAYEICNQ
jgi:hydroxypyruvate isomerase